MEAPTIRGNYSEVPLEDLKPNPWNYNKQSKTIFSKLAKSIKKNGFVQPIVVRSLKDKSLEIINGEHRWRAARLAGMDNVGVFDVGQMDDAEAKQLCIILNELGGEPDQIRLSELLQDINETVDFEDLAEVMPFPDKELSMMLEVADFSFDKLPDVNVKAALADPEDEDEDEDAPDPKAKKDKGVAGSIKRLKFQLGPDTHREMETKLAELGGDANAHIVKAIRAYHKAELERRKSRKDKAKTIVKKAGGRRRVGKKGNNGATDNADS